MIRSRYSKYSYITDTVGIDTGSTALVGVVTVHTDTVGINTVSIDLVGIDTLSTDTVGIDTLLIPIDLLSGCPIYINRNSLTQSQTENKSISITCYRLQFVSTLKTMYLQCVCSVSAVQYSVVVSV